MKHQIDVYSELRYGVEFVKLTTYYLEVHAVSL